MDGNGRWAERKGLFRIQGHQAGIKATRRTVRHARKLGIKYLTLFALSTENLKRPKQEVNALFDLLREFINKDVDELVENGVRLAVIGNIGLLPRDIQDLVADALDRTKSGKAMTLIIAIAYGGRDEIVRAVKKLLHTGQKNIAEHDFAKFLDTADFPDPDMLIRTGNELRTSNCLIWQTAYAELYFTKTLWPDFSRRHLLNAVKEYQRRERRFGLTSAQLSSKTIS
jgi:undecaprenyl diphosphate synthase